VATEQPGGVVGRARGALDGAAGHQTALGTKADHGFTVATARQATKKKRRKWQAIHKK